MEYIRLAVILSAGIYLSERFPISLAVIFIISLIMVLTVQAIFKHKFNTKILLAALVFVIGAGVCSYAKSDASRDMSEYVARYVTLEGRICEIPVQKDGNVRYVVDVRRVTHKDNTEDMRSKLLLTADAGLRFGDSIVFSGFVENLDEKMNENGFDYALYYKSKGIFFKMYSSEVLPSDKTFHDYSPMTLGKYARVFVSDVIDTRYRGDFGAIMKAVLTGNKKEFSAEFSEVLTRTGTSRFYYPAFLHVSLFMTLLSFALSGFKRRSRDIITGFLLIIYALFNVSSVIIIKLCIISSLLIFWRRRYGYIYFPDIIGLTAIIMGLINPLIFFSAGFVLSMLSSVLIHYFLDYVSGKLSFIKSRYINRLVSIGIICTVGLLPLTAYYFNGVTVYQIAVSVILVPCSAIIILLSPLLILMQWLFHSAPIVGQAVSAVLFIMNRLPYLMDKLHMTEISLPKPSVLFLIIYVLLIVAAVKWVKHKRRDMLTALFVAVAFTVSLVTQQVMRLDDMEISFINVGQGDGALVRAPYRYNLLIDGGGGNAYSDYNPGEAVFLEYLVSEGISYVDSAFVSHYHKDHVQGIIAAIENIRVRNVFMPDNMEESEWRVKLEDAARKHNTIVHYISEETVLTYNNGMTLHIYPPPKKVELSSDENDTSFMYRLEYGDFSAVFTGDMSKFEEQCMLTRYTIEQSDILKVAHHGSDTSTGEKWLAAVKPEYSVISVGKNNTYALPNDEVINRLSDTTLYRTDRDGDIRFIAEKNGHIKTYTRR